MGQREISQEGAERGNHRRVSVALRDRRQTAPTARTDGSITALKYNYKRGGGIGGEREPLKGREEGARRSRMGQR